MESTLFTELTLNEQANLSGGGRSYGNRASAFSANVAEGNVVGNNLYQQSNAQAAATDVGNIFQAAANVID